MRGQGGMHPLGGEGSGRAYPVVVGARWVAGRSVLGGEVGGCFFFVCDWASGCIRSCGACTRLGGILVRGSCGHCTVSGPLSMPAYGPCAAQVARVFASPAVDEAAIDALFGSGCFVLRPPPSALAVIARAVFSSVRFSPFLAATGLPRSPNVGCPFSLQTRLGIDDSALGGGMPMMNPAMFAAAAGAPAGAAAAEEAAAPVAEKTAFDLKLLSFEPAKKIGVIKEVRSLTNLGLKEAKALVEEAPKVFMTGVAKADAEGIRDKIEGLGGKVALE